MSTAIAAPQSRSNALRPLQETVADFKQECTGLESLIQGLFEDLDRLRVELERKALELDSERRRNEEQEAALQQQRDDARRLTEHLHLQEERLDAALKNMDALRQEFSQQHESISSRHDEQEEAARARVKKLEQEAESLRQQLQAATSGLLDNVRVTNELAAVQQELSQSKTELLRLHEQLTIATSTNVDASRMAEVERERNTLREEAASLKARAAELSVTVAEQKSELDRQRDEWTGELKHLRRFVETQAEIMAQRPAVSPSGDPVASSVLAQFNKLQRDLADRRKQRE